MRLISQGKLLATSPPPVGFQPASTNVGKHPRHLQNHHPGNRSLNVSQLDHIGGDQLPNLYDSVEIKGTFTSLLLCKCFFLFSYAKLFCLTRNLS